MKMHSIAIPVVAILALGACGTVGSAQKPVHGTGDGSASATASRTQASTTAPPAIAAGPTLERVVRLKPMFVSLADLLKSIHDQSGLVLKTGDSVPELRLFAASPGVVAQGELRQVRLLLTDAQWKYQWANRKLNPTTTEYLLWRAPVDPAQREQYERQRVRDRLSSLVQLLNAPPAALDDLAQRDPETAAILRQPVWRSWIALAGRLTPDQLNGVLAGRPLILPVSSLPTDEKAMLHQAMGRMGTVTTMDAHGVRHELFNPSKVDSMGEVKFNAEKGAEPGSLQLNISITSDPNLWDLGPGGDVLHPDQYAPDIQVQMAAAKARSSAAALEYITRPAKIVTIDHSMPLEKDEPPLAAYLRSFAQQTGLTILAFWPKGAKRPQQRLAESITRQPVSKALDALCRSYQCEWVTDDKIIRIRYNPSVKAAAEEGEPGRK
ncbi:MAG TPA: hypothetical protein VFJ58_17120 [Armatimonadota bacterium]|nr:hypothetical protein [Armatimonadota bacterium]